MFLERAKCQNDSKYNGFQHFWEAQNATKSLVAYGLEAQNDTKSLVAYGLEAQNATKSLVAYGLEAQNATKSLVAYGLEAQNATPQNHPKGARVAPRPKMIKS